VEIEFSSSSPPYRPTALHVQLTTTVLGLQGSSLLDILRSRLPETSEFHIGSGRLLAELRAERERQGLSLTDLMALTRIDRATINKLENGKVPNPTYSTLKAYARALGMRLAFHLGRSPADSTP
jgi:DNA-binding Xre family transcriptional regulator